MMTDAPTNSAPSVSARPHIINCKYCNHDISLKKCKRLPRKLLQERYGIYWCGLEKVYLLIYKVVCPNCKKKFTHKKFASTYIYT